MTKFLKGNFDVKKQPAAPKSETDLTDRFEQEALRKLGGSIAFVSRKKYLYGDKPATGKPAGPEKK